MIFPHLNPEPVKVRNLRAITKVPKVAPLQECRESLIEGIQSCWYEYIPSTYDGKADVPLILHIHGGGGDGRRYAMSSGWHLLAEKENIIVVYPNSLLFEHWECSDLEVEYLEKLILHLCEKYCIDRSRIYMQGLSNGDMMTNVFAMKRGYLLAAAGMITGPAMEGFLIEPTAELPIIQMRGEKDMTGSVEDSEDNPYMTRDTLNDRNREHWIKKNDAASEGSVLITGKNNLVKYEGKVPVIFWEVKDVPHYEPINTAQIFWDYLYSGARRVNGKIVMEPVRAQVHMGEKDFVFALGSNKIWKQNQVTEACEENGLVLYIQPDCKIPGWLETDTFHKKEMYAPVKMLSKMVDAEVVTDSFSDRVVVTAKDGTELIFENGMELVIVNQRLDSLKKPCIYLCGNLYIPICEVLQNYFGLHLSILDDVVYASENYAELAHGTARLLRKQLKGVLVSKPQK